MNIKVTAFTETKSSIIPVLFIALICQHAASFLFRNAGVQPNSQEAYEMACQGIIRPQDSDSPPVLYGVKCIEFTPPDFTLGKFYSGSLSMIG